jgi:hypothetical protein
MARSRLAYWRRVARSYAGGGATQLSFWWETPAVNEAATFDKLGPYYMTFADKARYQGPFDTSGVPLLHYHGAVGKQHNPIAIAQYGLASYNVGDVAKLRAQADWLAASLRPNARGVRVWMHDFDWEYGGGAGLVAPWYSGLAQGQGVSCLLRAHQATGELRYLDSARAAFAALRLPMEEGGVLSREGDDVWIEEYLTTPRSHILNGFLWALWGVHDMVVATGDADARALFHACETTVRRHLGDFDIGWWSLYDLLPNKLRCVASPFYHRLHVVQLRVMHRMTGRDEYRATAERWDAYARSGWKRRRALAHKATFKAFYY